MTDTEITQLIINRLTKTQYEGVTSPSENELWAVDPEFKGGKILATDASGDIVESGLVDTDVATKSEVEAKQDTLVSGETIKTINGESVLGAGNIQIQGGGGATLDNYLPNGTVINVNLDGSGDFTDLPSAIDYLTDKFSSGTVTIQLGEGTFELSEDLVIDQDKFNFGSLQIQGAGNNVTIIYRISEETYKSIIQVLNKGKTRFNALKIMSNKKNKIRGIQISQCATVFIEQVKLEGLEDGAIFSERGGMCYIGYGNYFINCIDTINAFGGNIAAGYNTVLYTSNVTNLLSVLNGGIVQLAYCKYTGSPTKATNQTIGTVSANGFITGSLTKQS